ncbi:MAG: PLP-dependent aminotransferase family protein [Pseudotabrizicola sp.]|uniref:aminotransferase-like domain-containing protein n=1 Tax=Pseudotabrizicola sp. TaxID=2939647 RepID=UPI00272182E1|nr:PLP-dependent aminotransferase family protein [Pseudotabrizicola sp.]MDO8884584.1 PLP-dependent aminotransferase family protein [Pseudotabrizicola sp.]MDP2083507.1 PLP-dependent aminotransferase family protein [Pseudotabrizicola sp.]MDZ7572892.1 PLP-dependent aminotransferase family protein [Pseudotabrizicola sp.]
MAQATRTVEVMENIRRRLASRALAPGERLPSIRRFAAVMGVSPSTVVDAYDRLVAEGVIRSQPGSGFYVVGVAPSLDLRAAGPQADRDVDPFWVSRQSLDADAGVLKPGCGWLPPDWMPQAALRRALRQLARGPDAVLTDYGSSLGPANLRHILARQFAGEGLDISPETILLTTSGSQSVDLICRYLLRPGDTVLVDDPCYFNFQALLRVYKARIVPVPFTPTGPDLAHFAAALADHRPRLYITNSALHNPTGGTITAQTAHRLLRLAASHDLTVIEDDTFAVLEPDLSPRLATLDGLDRVIRIGSFSKTLSASVRCGYIAGPPQLIAALTDLQVATNFGGPSPVATAIVHSALSDGSYRKHVDGVRKRLTRARKEAATRLSSLGAEPWLMPRGGFYLWCRLPEGRDAADIARAALKQNVVLAPGNIFSPAQTAAQYMRFNVTQMPQRAWEVLTGVLTTPQASARAAPQRQC